MKKMKMPKLGKRKFSKSSIGVAVVTAVFAILGVVFLIIGYHDTVLDWMKTTGIALLVISVIPLLIVAYLLIQRKIES